MRNWLVAILIPSALLLSLARSARALPPSSKKGERSAKAPEKGGKAGHLDSPAACPSVTVIVKERSAPEAKQIATLIRRQSYEHWWESPNAPEWALFLLTIPYVIVTGGLFYLTRRGQVTLERAWLFIIPSAARLIWAEGYYALKVEFNRLNQGRSAGFVIGGRIVGKKLPGPLLEKPDDLAIERYGPTPVPQNEKIKEPPLIFSLSEKELEDFRDDKLTIALVGAIHYKDICSKVHKTRIGIYVKADKPFMCPTRTIGEVACRVEIGPSAYNLMT